MKLANNKTLNLKTTLAGLALVGFLPLAAKAGGIQTHRDRTAANLSGEIQISHQTPGGVITVGAEWGQRPQPQVVIVKERQPQPQVVIVKERRPEVVVVEKRHGREWGHGPKRDRREVTVVRKEPVRPKVVVVDNRDCARQEQVVRHEYRDGKQVSIDEKGPNGTYHYYEDAHQVSIDDNRDGNLRHVYVRK